MENIGNYSDHDLIQAIRNNDEKAFEVLFNRHWKKAHTTAYAVLHDHALTQEIVQDIFLNLWERRESLSIANFQQYLRLSIKYKVIDYIKHKAVREKYKDYYRYFASTVEEKTLHMVEYRDLQASLEEGLQNLPEKTQYVFKLNRLEGRSITEIAELLNVSEKAVQYHLTRSSKELRHHLRDFIAVLLILNHSMLL